jgi:hypothetical protein
MFTILVEGLSQSGLTEMGVALKTIDSRSGGYQRGLGGLIGPSVSIEQSYDSYKLP